MMTEQLIVGSTAMNYWFPEFNRTPKDLDIMVKGPTKLKKSDRVKTEYLHCPLIFDLVKETLMGLKIEFLHPRGLLLLKASSIFWRQDVIDKDLWDIHFLVKNGLRIEIEDFYKMYDFWTSLHGPNKRSDLTLSADEFFDNAINNEDVDHDYLHVLLCDPPAYQKILKDGCEVETCPNKFESLPHKEKLEIIQQEVMVMASERFKGLPYRAKYGRMLKKFLLSHCPLWSVPFMLENWAELSNCPFNFMELLNKKLASQGKKELP